MPSEKNKKILENFTQILSEYDEFFITENKGLNVADLGELRTKLQENGSIYHVVKNRVFKIALNNKKISDLDQYLVGSNGILFTKDPIKAAKVIDNFAKLKKEKIEIKAGFAEGKIIESSYIRELASLSSREELVSKFMFILKNPLQKLVVVLDSIAKEKK